MKRLAAQTEEVDDDITWKLTQRWDNTIGDDKLLLIIASPSTPAP
jgi:hypothetical protein